MGDFKRLTFYSLFILCWVILVSPQSLPDSLLKPNNFTDLKLSDVLHAKALIRWLINNRTENGTHTFNAGFIRLAFHDCVGGCNGCVNLNNPSNRGLRFYKVPLDLMYDTIANRWMSRADWYALAGIVAVEYAAELTPCEGSGCKPSIEFRWGRRDCVNERIFMQRFPQMNGDPRNSIRRTFRMNMMEITALMGAHTLGKHHNAHTKWVEKEDILNNQYYKDMLDSSLGWRLGMRNGSLSNSWSHADGSNIMFHCDMVMAYDIVNNEDICSPDPSRICPNSSTFEIVKMFAEDNNYWLQEFSWSFFMMLQNGNFNNLKQITSDTSETEFTGTLIIPNPRSNTTTTPETTPQTNGTGLTTANPETEPTTPLSTVQTTTLSSDDSIVETTPSIAVTPKDRRNIVVEETTQSPPSSTTQSPPSSTTQSPPSSTTQSPPSSTTQSPPSSTTQSPPSSTTQSPPSSTEASLANNKSQSSSAAASHTETEPSPTTTQTPLHTTHAPPATTQTLPTTTQAVISTVTSKSSATTVIRITDKNETTADTLPATPATVNLNDVRRFALKSGDQRVGFRFDFSSLRKQHQVNLSARKRFLKLKRQRAKVLNQKNTTPV